MKYLLAFIVLILPGNVFSQDLPVYTGTPVVDQVVSGYFLDEGGDTEVLPGCSWYCGGHVDRFSASSSLADTPAVSYKPRNAHDFDLNTAWVEGAAGDGIGVRLDYVVDMVSPEDLNPGLGINKLIVWNGYYKTAKLWSANNRVKKLKLLVDGTPLGFIDLKDVRTVQTVELPLIPLPKGKMTTIGFEIVEVYKGTKYSDTAVTEILFGGTGVH